MLGVRNTDGVVGASAARAVAAGAARKYNAGADDSWLDRTSGVAASGAAASLGRKFRAA